MTRHAVVLGLLCVVASGAGAAAPSRAGRSTAPEPRMAIAAATRAPRAPASYELRVFAAASLHDAFTPLGAKLERRHPGLRVRFNFEGSQQLVSQLEQGAVADVFAAADERWMARARERGLLADSSQSFARNRLVVVLPKGDPGRVGSLQGLARAGVKLVIGADAVPVGHYARVMLAQLSRAPGFAPDYATRVLRNVASEEESVTSVLGKVRLGEADAGIVYASDVTGGSRGVVRVLDIPEPANVVASYPIAVLAGGHSPALAREFVALVRSSEGRQALERAGFLAATDAPR